MNTVVEQQLKELQAKASNKDINIPGANLSDIHSELRKIREKSSSTSANVIPYKEIADHTNVCLYHKDGKQVGPIHPASLEETWERFYKKGIVLLVKKPTEVEIEAYKQTDEYIKKHDEFLRKRKMKDKSRKPDQVNRLIDKMDKLIGEKSVNILDQGQVKQAKKLNAKSS